MFGGGGGGFGSSTTGNNNNNNPFGQRSSTFGQPAATTSTNSWGAAPAPATTAPTSAWGTSSLTSSTSTGGNTSQQQQQQQTTQTVNNGTGQPAYATFNEKDNMTTVAVHHTLAPNPAYSNWSFEELHMRDYEMGKRYAGQAAQSAFGQPASVSQPAGGAFGSSLFGVQQQQPATTSAFGASSGAFGASSGAFGQPAAPSLGFGQQQSATSTSTGGFGGGFGSTQPTSTFGQPTPSSNVFGAVAAAAQPNTGFGFGSTTQPAAASTGGFGSAFGQPATTASNPFGQSQATSTFGQPQPSTGFGGGFGGAAAAPTASAFGGGSTFGQPAAQQTGAFGQPAAAQTGSFGGFGQNSKPTIGFGAATTGGFGAGTSTFGQPAASTGFGTQPSTGFGAPTLTTGMFGAPQQQTTTGAFGAAVTQNPFGQQPAQQQQQQQTGFGFGQSAAKPGSNLSTTGFGAPQPAAAANTSFSFGQSAQTQKPGGFTSFGTSTTTQPLQSGAFGQQPATSAPSFSFGNTATGGTQPGFGATTGLFSTPAKPAATTSTGFSGFGTTPSMFGTSATTTNAQPVFNLGGTTSSSFGTGFGGGLFSNQQQQPSTQQGPALVANIDSNAYGTNPLLQPKTTIDGDKNASKPGAISTTSSIDNSVKKIPVLPNKARIFSTPSREVRLKGRAFSPAIAPMTPRERDNAFKQTEGVLYSADQFQSRKSVKKLEISERSAVKPLTNGHSLLDTVSKSTGKSNLYPSLSAASISASTTEKKKVTWKADNAQIGAERSYSYNEEFSVEPPTPIRKLDFTTSPGVKSAEKVKVSPVRTEILRDQSFTSVVSENIADESYVMKPTLQELLRMDMKSLKAIKNFEITHVDHGSVRWLEPVDLSVFIDDSQPYRGLAQIPGTAVRFTKKMCIVYEDSPSGKSKAIKHPRGQGLNKPAQITLHKCWPLDRSTRQPITDPENAKVKTHIQKLQAMDQTEFVNFDVESGSWVFKVDHFSIYGLMDDDDNENDQESAIVTVTEKRKVVDVTMQLPQSTHDLIDEEFSIHSTEYDPTADTSNIITIAQELAQEEASVMKSGMSTRDRRRQRSKHSALSDRASVRQSYASSSSTPSRPVMKKRSQPLTDGFEDLQRLSELNRAVKIPFPDTPKATTTRSEERDDSFGFQLRQEEVSTVSQVESIFESVPVLPDEVREDFEFMKSASQALPVIRMGITGIPCTDSKSDRHAEKIIYPAMGFRPCIAWTTGANGQQSMRVTCIERKDGARILKMRDVDIGLLTSSADLQLIKNEYERTLQIVFDHSTVREESLVPAAILSSLITFQSLVPKSQDVVGKLKSMAPKSVYNSTASEMMEYEVNLWKLGEALFDGPDLGDEDDTLTVDLIRKDKFSRWLKAQVKPAADADLKNSSSAGDQIFHLLISRQVKEAVTVALCDRKLHLATILSQISDSGGCNMPYSGGGGLDDNARDDIYTQLTAWLKPNNRGQLKSSEQWPVTPDFIRLYRLLCSDLEPIHAERKFDWKRTLGMYLWSWSTCDMPLSQVVSAFEYSFQKAKNVSPPRPWYVKNDLERDGTDLMFSMIRAHVHPTATLQSWNNIRSYYPPCQVARELKIGSVPSSRIAWMLQAVLASQQKNDSSMQVDSNNDSFLIVDCDSPLVRRHVLEENTASTLAVSFAIELESAGLWKWSVFVLMFIASAATREALIKGVLERAVAAIDRNELIASMKLGAVMEKSVNPQECVYSTSDEKFLLEKLAISESWLDEVKVAQCRLVDDHIGEAAYLLRSGHHVEAHSLLLERFIVSSFLRRRVSVVKDLVSAMSPSKISEWRLGAGLFADFYKFIDEQDIKLKNSLRNDLLVRLHGLEQSRQKGDAIFTRKVIHTPEFRLAMSEMISMLLSDEVKPQLHMRCSYQVLSILEEQFLMGLPLSVSQRTVVADHFSTAFFV